VGGSPMLGSDVGDFFYDDDSVAFSPKPCSQQTEQCVQLLYLLGLQVAREGQKAIKFCSCFYALGATTDLNVFHQGFLHFANTKKRAAELAETIGKTANSGHLSQAEALKLRGRRQFADGQLFGHVGQLRLRGITCHALQFQSTANDSKNLILMIFKSKVVALSAEP